VVPRPWHTPGPTGSASNTSMNGGLGSALTLRKLSMIPPPEATGNGRKAYEDSIPDELKEHLCKCASTITSDVTLRFVKLPSSGPVGILVHDKCKNPRNLWAYIEECENCEYLYYVTKFPDRTLLCSACDL